MSAEQKAEGHVCIFHQRVRALQAFRVQDTISKKCFDYGLCPICANRLKKQESFKAEISARLEELAEQLIKQNKERENAKTNNW